jgi:hypothetical protein
MVTEELLVLARLRGTDKQYRRWISHQPSCISGHFSGWVDGVGRCEAAHVAAPGSRGRGSKPNTHAFLSPVPSTPPSTSMGRRSLPPRNGGTPRS